MSYLIYDMSFLILFVTFLAIFLFISYKQGASSGDTTLSPTSISRIGLENVKIGSFSKIYTKSST